MALARQRLLTLAFADMETVRMVSQDHPYRFIPLAPLDDVDLAPQQFCCRFHQAQHIHGQLTPSQELESLARDWTKPPPDAVFSLRVPVEYASLHAAVSSSRFVPIIAYINNYIKRLVAGPYIYVGFPPRSRCFASHLLDHS
jgi:hypothetical protein